MQYLKIPIPQMALQTQVVKVKQFQKTQIVMCELHYTHSKERTQTFAMSAIEKGVGGKKDQHKQ